MGPAADEGVDNLAGQAIGEAEIGQMGPRIAGKTGTAYKYINNAYRDDRYLTSFIGIAPASRPRLVVAVQIDEPKIEDSGGLAAAPVFSKVMAEALRLLDIPPDNLPQMKSTTQTANTAGTP